MAAEVQLHDTPLMLPGAQDAVPLTERGGGVPRAQGSVPVAGAMALLKSSSGSMSPLAVFLCTPIMKIGVRRLKRKRSYLWDD